MTELLHADSAILAAVEDAEGAADRAGVVVRELTGFDEQAEVLRLLATIWGRDSQNPVVPPELLRALGKAGSYIAGAFAGQELVGAAVAFHSAPERHALHSHIAGVVPSYAGHSVGFAMKLHQRAWALAHGIDVIEWTFDPLVARNAHFNIQKLRARPVEYLANFYGVLVDTINRGDDTDRLLVRWELRDPDVVAAAVGGTAPLVRGDGILVPVPADIEGLRTTDPESAHRWRREVREELSSLLAAGGRIVGFDRAAGYVVRMPAGGSEEIAP